MDANFFPFLSFFLAMHCHDEFVPVQGRNACKCKWCLTATTHDATNTLREVKG